MSFGGIKRTKHDAVFSDLVRMRVDYTCEMCGKYYPPGSRQGIQCAHLFGRRYRGTRWHPDNAFCLCTFCHQNTGDNPVFFHGWAELQLGRGRIDMLMEKSQAVTKYSKFDLEDLYKHMKAQFKKMEMARKSGEVGRLEFEPWQ